MEIRLKDKKQWDEYVKKNQDPYSKTCIRVAYRVMELLEETPLKKYFFQKRCTAQDLIHKANEETEANITLFMSQIVAQIVIYFHVKGDEFEKSYQKSIRTL